MPGYLIVDIAGIQDHDLYAQYREKVSDGLLAAGGHYLARGGPIDVLEGDWRPSRIVLVRFDTTQVARDWWASDEYATLKPMRQHSTHTNMILIEGSQTEPEPSR